MHINGLLGQAMVGKNTKVLGLLWDPSNDCFHYNPGGVIKAAEEMGRILTKRQILRISGRDLDPLAHLGPIVLLWQKTFKHLWLCEGE